MVLNGEISQRDGPRCSAHVTCPRACLLTGGRGGTGELVRVGIGRAAVVRRECARRIWGSNPKGLKEKGPHSPGRVGGCVKTDVSARVQAAFAAAVGAVQRGRVDAVDDDRARRAQLCERRARLKPRQLTNF